MKKLSSSDSKDKYSWLNLFVEEANAEPISISTLIITGIIGALVGSIVGQLALAKWQTRQMAQKIRV